MARPATGSIVEHRGKDGRVYRSLRFRYGGTRHDPARRDPARGRPVELRGAMSEIERGIEPAVLKASRAKPEPERPAESPGFHRFAAEWWTRKEGEWSPNTQADYRWRLEAHLVPHFEETPLDRIDIDAVERQGGEARRGEAHP